MKPLSLAEQLSVLETTREEGAVGLLPAALTSVKVQSPNATAETHAQLALDKARTLWDSLHPGPTAIRSFLLVTLEQMKVTDDFARAQDWEDFCNAVQVAGEVDLVPIDDFSNDDLVLLDYAGLVLNRQSPPDSFLSQIHADGPLQESPMPDRFADLLALRFFMAVCALPSNPDPRFQDTLKDAALSGDGAHVKLKAYASTLLERYVTFLSTLPEVTASASLGYFSQTSKNPDFAEALVPYCGSAQGLADLGPGYNVGRYLIASALMDASRSSANNTVALRLESYLPALLDPTDNIELAYSSSALLH